MGGIRLEVNTGARRGSSGVLHDGALNQKTVGGDYRNALTVVIVADAVADHDVAARYVRRLSADINAVAAGIGEHKIIDRHITNAQKVDCMAPLSPQIRRSLIVLDAHLERSTFSETTHHYIRNAVERE